MITSDEVTVMILAAVNKGLKTPPDKITYFNKKKALLFEEVNYIITQADIYFRYEEVFIPLVNSQKEVIFYESFVDYMALGEHGGNIACLGRFINDLYETSTEIAGLFEYWLLILVYEDLKTRNLTKKVSRNFSGFFFTKFRGHLIDYFWTSEIFSNLAVELVEDLSLDRSSITGSEAFNTFVKWCNRLKVEILVDDFGSQCAKNYNLVNALFRECNNFKYIKVSHETYEKQDIIADSAGEAMFFCEVMAQAKLSLELGFVPQIVLEGVLNFEHYQTISRHFPDFQFLVQWREYNKVSKDLPLGINYAIPEMDRRYPKKRRREES